MTAMVSSLRAQGNQLFDDVITQLRTSRDETGAALNLYGVMCSDDTGTRRHDFSDPGPVNTRCISKVVACLALGAAMDRRLRIDGAPLSLDTPIWPYLRHVAEVRAPETSAVWATLRIVDLLRLTLGHDTGLLWSTDVDGRDQSLFLDEVVNHPVTGRAGRDFRYSSAGTFVLSVLLSEALGTGLDELAARYVLEPLGITDFSWDRYDQYCAGSSGLRLRLGDMHRIGELLLHDGRWHGKQLVSPAFVELMRTPQVAAPTHRYIPGRAFPKWSYGLNLWLCGDGDYYADGTFSQYLIVIPRRRRVVSVLGHQSDTVPVSNALRQFK